MVSHYTEFAAITLIHACRVAAAAGPGNLALRSAAIRAFVFVMAAACVLMLAALGSVVIAATGVLLDLLSVSAAYGVMTAIFQHGWGAALVGTRTSSSSGSASRSPSCWTRP